MTELFPNREGLRAFLKANGRELCEECGCCELFMDACARRSADRKSVV